MVRSAAVLAGVFMSIGLSACGNDVAATQSESDAPSVSDTVSEPETPEPSAETIDLNNVSQTAEWDASITATCESAADVQKCFQDTVEGTTVTMSGPVLLAMDVEGVMIVSVGADNPHLKVQGVNEAFETQYGMDFVCPLDLAGCAEIVKGDIVGFVARYEYVQYPGMEPGIDLRVTSIT